MAQPSSRPRRRDPRGDAFDTRMLAVADELFAEFDHLPVMAVIRAIVAAQTQVRGTGTDEPPSPEHIAAVARQRLLQHGEGQHRLAGAGV